MPSLSVCVTHYGRAHLLHRSLNSLARQTRVPDEVLIWDDHSPENPYPVVAQYQSCFPRLIYHRNDSNLGMPGNLNSVVAAATGELIANLHDADEYDPRLLELWEGALAAHPSAGFVFCALDHQRHSGGQGPRTQSDFPQVSKGSTFFEQAFVGKVASPVWGTVMARQSAYRMHLPFDHRFGPWADVDMWMRICSSHDVCYVALPLIFLDNSRTAHRSFRWETVRLLQSMFFLNIRRMACSAEQRDEWLTRQQIRLIAHLLRLVAGGAAKGDYRRAVSGALKLRDWLRLLTGRLGTETSIPSHPLCRTSVRHELSDQE